MGVPRYPLTILQKRYLIDLDQLKEWLEALNVTVYPNPDGIDRHASIEEKDIARLDALHRHIQDGGELDDFVGLTLPEVLPHQDLLPTTKHDLAAISRPELLPAWQTLIANQAYAPTSNSDYSLTDLRERFEFLDDCAARQWLLTTDQASAILGLKSSTVSARAKGSGTFRWQSWLFSRVGRQGRESLWQVRTAQLQANESIVSTKKKKKI